MLKNYCILFCLAMSQDFINGGAPGGTSDSQQILLQALAAYSAQLNLSAPNPNTIINTCICPVPPQAIPIPLPNFLITMQNAAGTTVNSFTFPTNINFKSRIAILTVQLFPQSNQISSTAITTFGSETSYAIVYTLQSPDGLYFQKEIQYPTAFALTTFLKISNGIPTIPITLTISQIASPSNLLLNTTQITASFTGLPVTTQQQLLNSISPITQKFLVTVNNPVASCLITAACTATTTTNLAATYNNGTSGVSATLTALSNGTFSTDGVFPTLNSRILVKNQTTTFQNGIYTLTTIGSSSTAWVLTRATDYDTVCEIQYGTYVPITSGTAYANTAWQETATITTIGTSPILFSQLATPTLTITAMSGSYDPNSNTTTPKLISSLIPSTVTTVPPIETTNDIAIAPITITLYNGTTPYPITFQSYPNTSAAQGVNFNQTDLINGLNLNLFIYPPLYQNGSISNSFIFIATLQTIDGLKFRKLVYQTIPFTNYPITFQITTTSLEGQKTTLISNIANPLLTQQIYNMISPIHLKILLQQNNDVNAINNDIIVSIM